MGRTKSYVDEFFRNHKGEYDIVHLHAPNMAFLVFPIAEKYGIRHRIVHSHATLYAENKTKAIRNRILWNMAKGTVTDRIACSEAAGNFLFRDEPYTVLKNAIECEKYLFEPDVRERVRNQEEISSHQLVVGNVGRFSQQKNQTFLIDIFSEVKNEQPDAVLWLIGDGELRNQIEAKIRENGLTLWAWDDLKKPEHYDVKMFGMVEQTKDLYQAMDVMVMPSLYEGLPMVGVEAQASGLPCVLSDTITREVDIVGCSYLPLKKTPREWAEETIRIASAEDKMYKRDTHDYRQELDKLGFNIRLETKRLERIYLEDKKR
jgi:glycosyltransferase involved in cell wall biosynthesis